MIPSLKPYGPLPAWCAGLLSLATTSNALADLSISNANFDNVTGLTSLGGGWYKGQPQGWTTAHADLSYSVLVSGTDGVANLQQLSQTSSDVLYQDIGTVAATSNVTISFTITQLAAGSTTDGGVAIWGANGFTNLLATANFTSDGVKTITALNVPAGTPIRIGFWRNANSAPGLDNVSLTVPPILYTNEWNTTGTWTLPTGTNLLNANAITTPSNPTYDHGGGALSSPTWSVLTDGALGAPTNKLAGVSPSSGDSVIFPLDVSVNTKGYNITSFDSYGSWPDYGRDDQQYELSYSTWDAPSVFIPLITVNNHTGGTSLSTHTRLDPASGYLASGVAAFKLVFNNQENGYVSYREFIALGSAAPLTTPLTWTGNGGSGGNATWAGGADNNWTPGSYVDSAPLLFDATGTNRNITLPATTTAASMNFSNNAATPYTFGGSTLNVTNDITLAGGGNATFNNPTGALTGVNLTGSGSLVFNAALAASGVNVTGTGSLTLNAANPGLTGSVGVAGGTLTVANSGALAVDPLIVTGGTVKFVTKEPQIVSLSGSGGQIVLGNTTGPVNTTLLVGDHSSATTFSGGISQASGTTGGIFKLDDSSLTLAGDNTYTGTTTVLQGALEMGQRLSLYHGNTAAWTASNLAVSSGAAMIFSAGGATGFTDTDLTTISLGGFESGAVFGIDNAAAFSFNGSLSADVGVLKKGTGILTLTGANTFPTLTVDDGAVILANPTGHALAGDVFLGDDGHASLTLRMGAADQFGPNSVVHGTSLGVQQSVFTLGGFNQTVAGLESPLSSRLTIVQNEEAGTPGYPGTAPGPVTLTINAASDHVFSNGLIRNNLGGALSIVKNGTGTQELGNNGVQGYGYTGDTTINQGTLRLNFTSAKNTGWSSNIVVAAGATFELDSDPVTSNWNFFRRISGAGQVIKTGPGYISQAITDGAGNGNSYTGGTDIKAGTLKFYSDNPTAGLGTAAGQFAAAGMMDPSNVITVRSGARMGIGGTAPLGNSGMLPQFANTVKIQPGGKLWGGDGSADIGFIANLFLDGAVVEVTNGFGNGWNTNLAFVGTVTVGGTSATPSTVITTGATANSTISLGSLGLPGTTFQVADVTGDAAVDFPVDAVLQDVRGTPSSLTKTGAGTMSLMKANTYTGDTTVNAGTLAVTGNSIVDTNKVILNGGKLGIAAAANETVGTLYYGATQQAAGTYGSTSSSATFRDDTRFSGTGILTVTSGPTGTDAYTTWAAQISDPAQRGRTADPDGDGFTNEQEYLFGTSPTASTGSLSQVVKNGSGLVIQWNQLSTGTSTYVLKESSTLQSGSWTTSPLVVVDNPSQNVPGYIRKQATVPLDSPRKFYRVEATE